MIKIKKFEIPYTNDCSLFITIKEDENIIYELKEYQSNDLNDLKNQAEKDSVLFQSFWGEFIETLYEAIDDGSFIEEANKLELNEKKIILGKLVVKKVI